ncbi:MAG: hypothetical protein V3V28_01920 [Polaribacter sp.]|uniref:hypothetical protein n=1 Tax=Polaribacter sp. TaxID=1920175 RepID=UPI002F35AA92
MKNLQNLGESLSRTEQQTVNGGRRTWHILRTCFSGGAGVSFGCPSSAWECCDGVCKKAC